MRFFVIFLGLSLSFLLSACALTTTNDHYNQAVASWRWGHSSQLLQSWGNPNQIAKLPNGNKVYIYQKETYKNYPPPPATASIATVSVPTGRSFIVVPTANTPTVGSSFLLTCTTSFEIDPRGIIVNERASGNNCTADEGFTMSKSNPHPRQMTAAPKRITTQ